MLEYQLNMAKKQAGEEEGKNELEREVDRMMDPRQPDEPPQSSKPEPEDSSEKTLVIDNSEAAETPAASETPPEENTTMDDADTAAAIDAISKSDSDELLEAEDQKFSSGRVIPKKPKRSKKKLWLWIALFILACVIAAFAVPTSRYWLLNHFGMRGQVSLTVLNNGTGLPLQNVSVTIDNHEQASGKNGQVLLSGVELGDQTLTVKAPAFATVQRDLTVEPGQNQLGKIGLKPTGISYKFNLTDYLSGQPIVGGTASVGPSVATSNTAGQTVLILEHPPSNGTQVRFSASGYDSKTINIGASGQTADIRLVPAGKDYFLSPGSGGSFSIFSADLDGGNRKLLLSNVDNDLTGAQLAASSSQPLLALVDSGSGQSSAAQTLTVINASTNQPLTLDKAESIKLIGWLDGSTLVYTAGGACGSQGETCYQLKSYDYKSGASQQLARASSFSSVITIGDRIYYVAGGDSSQSGQSEFAAVNPDGTNQDTLLSQAVLGVYRVGYGKIDLAATGQWYGFDASSNQAQKIAAPAAPANYFYVDSPNGKLSAWINNGQLMVYDTSSQTSRAVSGVTGASYPVNWADDNALIYRADGGTADYAVSLAGGQPKKIVDVTNVAGANGL